MCLPVLHLLPSGFPFLWSASGSGESHYGEAGGNWKTGAISVELPLDFSGRMYVKVQIRGKLPNKFLPQPSPDALKIVTVTWCYEKRRFRVRVQGRCTWSNPPLLKGEHQLGCTWLMIILWVVDFATFPKTCHLMVWHQKSWNHWTVASSWHRTSARITNSVTQWPNIGQTGCTQMILILSCKLPLDTQPGCASVHPHETIDVVYRVSLLFWNLQGAQRPYSLI